MRALWITFTAAAFIIGCESAEDVKVTYAEKEAKVEKTVARISVEGMMCEIACGGKIRKELSELDGVANASIEYRDGEAVNFALVEFNPERIHEADLADCINRISDGKLYSVSEMEVTHYAPGASLSRTVGADDVNMSRGFELPGISDILRSFLSGIRN